MTLDAPYAACERLARTHYENFPVASRLLPARMRPHVAAVYAFARVADDIADEGDAAIAVRHARLDEWIARLHGAMSSARRACRSVDADAGDARRRRSRSSWRSRHRCALELPHRCFEDL